MKSVHMYRPHPTQAAARERHSFESGKLFRRVKYPAGDSGWVQKR